jgi:hypothetical protein
MGMKSNFEYPHAKTHFGKHSYEIKFDPTYSKNMIVNE